MAVFDVSDLSNHRLVALPRLHAARVRAVRVRHPLLVSADDAGALCVSLLSDTGVRAAARTVIPGLLDLAFEPLEPSLPSGAPGADALLISTTDRRVRRVTLPGADALAAWPHGAPLPLGADEAALPSAAALLCAGGPGGAGGAWLLAACADRALRAFSVTLAPGAFALAPAGEDTSAPAQCSAIAADAAGAVLVGGADGSVALRTRAALGAGGARHRRHRGFTGGGVSAAAVGEGALAGWLVSGSADGSLVVQAKDPLAPPAAAPPGAVPVLEG